LRHTAHIKSQTISIVQTKIFFFLRRLILCLLNESFSAAWVMQHRIWGKFVNDELKMMLKKAFVVCSVYCCNV